MNDHLRGDEEFIMTSLANSFTGRWRCGENPPDAYLTLGNREIAVEISTLVEFRNDGRVRSGGRGRPISVASDFMPAVQLANELNEELKEEIPQGRGLILGLKRPFLRKRAVKRQLTAEIRKLLASGGSERKLNIANNEITIKLSSEWHDHRRHAVAIINSSSLPRQEILTTAWCILEERIATKAEKCRSLKFKSPIWLALFIGYHLADIDTYRQAFKMFSLDHPFLKILLVLRDGSVDELYQPP